MRSLGLCVSRRPCGPPHTPPRLRGTPRVPRRDVARAHRRAACHARIGSRIHLVRQSVAISGNQWQSLVRGTQWQSKAIRGNQRHSLPQVHNCPASSMHAVHAPPHAIICTRTPASGPSTNRGMRSELFKPCPSRPYLHAQSERPLACHISQSGRRHQHAPSARPACTIREAIREVIREDTSEAIREAFRQTIGNLSARNQHAIGTQSARNQHAISTQSAHNQHVIST
jgi:hypothetical protein